MTLLKKITLKSVKSNEIFKIRDVFNLSKKSKIYEYDLKKKINFFKSMNSIEKKLIETLKKTFKINKIPKILKNLKWVI